MKSTVIFGVLASALVTTSIARAGVIYTEDFGTETGPLSLASVGWGAWSGTAATDVSSTAWNPVYLPNAVGVTGRYVYVGSVPSLVTTTEPGSVATTALESVSFVARCDNTSATMRVVAQIEDDWYATSTAFNDNDGTGDWAEAATLTFTWTNAASAWQQLNFDPGSGLSLGSAVSSDLSGSVTAFGVFFGDSSASRIDNFTVSAVPEPGTLLLVFTGLVPLLVWPRLRRRST